MPLGIQRSSQIQLPLFVYLALSSSVLGQVSDLLFSLAHFVKKKKKGQLGELFCHFVQGDFCWVLGLDSTLPNQLPPAIHGFIALL